MSSKRTFVNSWGINIDGSNQDKLSHFSKTKEGYKSDRSHRKASDTEFVSDSEEELDFTDTDVPDFVEPTIRSNTPSEPEQQMYAKGKGAKLFRKRQANGLIFSSFWTNFRF